MSEPPPSPEWLAAWDQLAESSRKLAATWDSMLLMFHELSDLQDLAREFDSILNEHGIHYWEPPDTAEPEAS